MDVYPTWYHWVSGRRLDAAVIWMAGQLFWASLVCPIQFHLCPMYRSPIPHEWWNRFKPYPFRYNDFKEEYKIKTWQPLIFSSYIYPLYESLWNSANVSRFQLLSPVHKSCRDPHIDKYPGKRRTKRLEMARRGRRYRPASQTEAGNCSTPKWFHITFSIREEIRDLSPFTRDFFQNCWTERIIWCAYRAIMDDKLMLVEGICGFGKNK